MNPARAVLLRRQLALAYYYLFVLRRKRAYWVHDIYKSRQREGEYHTLMLRLRADPEEFFKYFRMDQAAFDKLLEKIRHRCVFLSGKRLPTPAWATKTTADGVSKPRR